MAYEVQKTGPTVSLLLFSAADPGKSCGAGASSEHVPHSTGGDKELPHLQGTWEVYLLFRCVEFNTLLLLWSH